MIITIGSQSFTGENIISAELKRSIGGVTIGAAVSGSLSALLTGCNGTLMNKRVRVYEGEELLGTYFVSG